MAEQVLAVDIGGTKIAVAMVDDRGGLEAATIRPTPSSADADVVFAARTVDASAADELLRDVTRPLALVNVSGLLAPATRLPSSATS